MVRAVLVVSFALGLVLARPAAAEVELRMSDVRASAPLGSLARGRLRLWLATHVEICQIDAAKSRPIAGDLVVHLEVGARAAPRITVAAGGKMPRAVASCLARNLRKVAFAELAPALTWDGRLTIDPAGPSIAVAVESLDSALDDFVIRSVMRAALEEPAPCMTAFFTAAPPISAVVVATFDATGVHVAESTADPGGAVACVAQQLAAVRLPADQLRRARLRISLLRPTTEIDPSVPTLTVGPAAKP
jgi:hypothetical protein